MMIQQTKNYNNLNFETYGTTTNLSSNFIKNKTSNSEKNPLIIYSSIRQKGNEKTKPQL